MIIVSLQLDITDTHVETKILSTSGGATYGDIAQFLRAAATHFDKLQKEAEK